MICWDVGADIVEDQAVLQDADQDGADDRAEDGADAAEQAGAADDDRGDHDQFVTLAGDRLRRVQPRGEDEAGQAGHETHQHVDRHGDAAHVQTRQARGFRVAADAVHVATIAGVAQDDMGHDGQDQEEDDRDGDLADQRQGEQVALAPPAVAGFEAGDRAAAGHEQGPHPGRRTCRPG